MKMTNDNIAQLSPHYGGGARRAERVFIFILLMLASVSSFAADRLFYVSRNLNRNIIVYDLRLKNGELDLDEPLHVYWYNQEKNPVTTNELNFIQRKMAYGYSVTKKGNDEVNVKLKAYSKREVRIHKHEGKWIARVVINGKDCILTEIYAHCPSKTSCDYIELRGNSLSDGSVQKERIKA